MPSPSALAGLRIEGPEDRPFYFKDPLRHLWALVSVCDALSRRVRLGELAAVEEHHAEVEGTEGVAAVVTATVGGFSTGQVTTPLEHLAVLERAIGSASFVGAPIRDLRSSEVAELFEHRTHAVSTLDVASFVSTPECRKRSLKVVTIDALLCGYQGVKRTFVRGCHGRGSIYAVTLRLLRARASGGCSPPMTDANATDTATATLGVRQTTLPGQAA
jgi:hypothetical protein